MISVTHVEVEMAVRHLWGNVEQPKLEGWEVVFGSCQLRGEI